MRGFHPSMNSVQAQQYADGGVVSRIKSAFGFTPKSRSQPASDDKGQPAPAPTPEQQPAQAKEPKKAISQYAAGSALSRRMAEIDKYADGGMVRGPGTGTSDEISRSVPEGSYIMPADSTAQMGEQTLESMGAKGFKPRKGGKNVPIQVSNGEYQMPPEQVHAVGVQALNAMKDATHTPVAQGFKPKNAEPAWFFADGGVVDEEKRVNNSFGDAAAVSNAAAQGASAPVSQPQAPRQTPAPTPDNPTPATANVTRGAAFGVYQRPETAGNRGGMMQPYAATGPSTFEPAKTPATGFGRMNATTDPRSLTYGGSDPAPERGYQGVGFRPSSAATSATNPSSNTGSDFQDNAPMPANDFGARGFGFPGQTATTSASTESTASPATTGNVKKTVGPDGKVTYSGGNISGDITVNGQAPRGSVTDLAGAGGSLAERLASIERTSAINRDIAGLRQQIQQGEDARTGLIPGGGMAILGSSPSTMFERTPEQQLRDAQVSARTLTSKWSRNSRTGMSPQEVELASLRKDQAGQRTLANNVQIQDMRNSGDLARTAMREEGANQRSLVQAAIDQQKINQDGVTQGFANRAAQQIEQLRGTLLDPNSTPEQRQSAQQALMALQGKEAANRFTVVPGGQEWDTTAGAMRNVPARVLNNQTGQFVQQPGQGGPAQQTPAIGTVQQGYRFKGGDPSSPSSWEKA